MRRPKNITYHQKDRNLELTYEDFSWKIAAELLRVFSPSAEVRGHGPHERKIQAGKKYIAINGDEGEPGTFKDRYYLESDPHRFLEGLLIAANFIKAHEVYIYIRDEYPTVIEILKKEISILEKEQIIPANYFILRRGAWAHICGEESAMIESIEGKRGLPRHRPPYVAENGLFGKPTLTNNLETIY